MAVVPAGSMDAALKLPADPVMLPVMVPVLKLPDASRLTIVDGVLALVPSTPFPDPVTLYPLP